MKLWIIMRAQMRCFQSGNAVVPYSHAQTGAFDANTLGHDISTPGFLHPVWRRRGRRRLHMSGPAACRRFGLCKLTHRSGACRPGRTEPPVPSISRADDPATTEDFGQQSPQKTAPHTLDFRDRKLKVCICVCVLSLY